MKTLISSIIICVLFLSCSKNPKCRGAHNISGIIEADAQIDCTPEGKEMEFVIKDDATFNQFFTDSYTGQLRCELPEIDFTTHSLLGLYATGQCQIKFNKEVTRNDLEHNYHYEVIIKSCGACKSMGYSYNWVLVPKIPNNWNVTFQKIEA